MAQSEIIEILKRYCTLLNLSGIKIEKAFLYDSHVRGEAIPESDIDVMLASKSFDNSDAEANIKVWSFTRKVDTRIAPYTVGLQQFLNDEVSPLLQIVNISSSRSSQGIPSPSPINRQLYLCSFDTSLKEGSHRF